MYKKLIIFSLFLMILSFPGLCSEDNYLVEPGVGIGDFKLGAITLSQMENWLGPADKEFKSGEATVLWYEKYNFLFTFDQNSMLVMIDALNPYYHTLEGIKVGCDISDAVKIYPNGSFEEEINGKASYGCNGMVIFFDTSTNIITSIAVYGYGTK